MREHQQNTRNSFRDVDETTISRRAAVGSVGAAILGVLSSVTFGREETGEGGRRGMPQDMRERMEQSRAFSERMQKAASMEERMKIMAERSAWDRARAVEELKRQLDVSDAEWSVIKPRIEAVYSLVHPTPQLGRGEARPMTPVEQKKRELRELLDNKDATPEQMKAGLTALRAANEKARQDLARARQDLRQLMTVRQEAVLVLSGLLD
ncbi:MAG: hypothetical protein ABFE13_13555 [Phycisphaerales bacterium]